MDITPEDLYFKTDLTGGPNQQEYRLTSNVEGYGFKSRPSQMDDLQNVCFLQPSLALYINRIR